MSTQLKQKAISSVGWSALDICVRQGVQFVTSICLARLLSPEEFGIMGMLLIFMAIAAIFVDGGFASALIQRQSVTAEETASVFYFNVGMGLLVAVLLALAAPWIAAFYAMPILTPLTRLMAVTFVVTSFGSVQWALLSKELDFRSQMRIGLVTSVLSGALGIVLAWRGWGVWSLALQSLFSSVLSTTLVWYWRPWRPGWAFSFKALRPLYRFGSFLMLSGLLDALVSRLNTLVIGKFYSVRDLGFYTRADSTRQLPTNLLSSVISRVAFPLFSAAATDKDLLLRGLRKAVRSSMLLNIPAMAGLAAVARPLVVTLFGSKWLPAVPYLQILALAGIFWPLHVLNLNYLTATGQSRLFFRLEILKKILAITALLLASPVSVLAMAWSQVVVGILCFFLNAHYTGIQLGYTPLKQLRDVWLVALAAAGMVTFVLVTPALGRWPAPACLAVQVSGGAIVFFGLCHLLRFEPAAEMRHQVLKWLRLHNRPLPNLA